MARPHRVIHYVTSTALNKESVPMCFFVSSQYYPWVWREISTALADLAVMSSIQHCCDRVFNLCWGVNTTFPAPVLVFCWYDTASTCCAFVNRAASVSPLQHKIASNFWGKNSLTRSAQAIVAKIILQQAYLAISAWVKEVKQRSPLFYLNLAAGIALQEISCCKSS